MSSRESGAGALALAPATPGVPLDVSPALPKLEAAALGDAASPQAMERLVQAIEALKQQAVRPMLELSILAIQADDWATGAARAIDVLQIDERNGYGWWLLAICREKAGDVRSAIACYESALQLLPEHSEIANDLGRLALQLGELDVAAQLFAHFLAHHPNHPEGVNNLACVLRDQGRSSEAIEILRESLGANPNEALLWNTLGTVLNEQGDMTNALIFYEEALRLDPDFAKARYNHGNALLASGDTVGALADVDAALATNPPAAESAMMRLARASVLLAAGDLERGWDAYEARLDPHYVGTTHFAIDRPAWTPETDVEGRSVLVVGEQGLGDEIAFGGVLRDLIAALGPKGRLTLAVEQRQVALFQRAFPQARVGAHATFKVDAKVIRTVPFLDDPERIDLWAPMASLLRRWRRTVESFPSDGAYLSADPAAVEAWRARLAKLGPAPKVGILWKSLRTDSARRRYFSAFDLWRPILETPGMRFVNLQYGDCAAELAQVEAAGLSLWTPPGIDLKQDLDGVAALTSALDLIIGPANASSNIAAACGAPVWLISVPGAWTRLGTDRYPWYPQARVFTAASLNDWAPVMAAVAQALKTAL